MYISKKNKNIVGELTLDGSKSISNRVLIIQKLCEQSFEIHKLSTSKDTRTLEKLLAQTDSNVFDAGHAGTTFRFMTAYLATQLGEQILTGSERMKQRPIGKLVTALNTLGADIEYIESEGYPPLKIKSPKVLDNNALNISADTSSQYITALLLIAPTLPQGIKLSLEGTIVSRPYIEMTLTLMGQFGVTYTWENQTIIVPQQKYIAKDITIEADWSAASYYYALAAFAIDLDLQLNGLFRQSTQGDSAVATFGKSFGIHTSFNEKGIRLSKIVGESTSMFEADFITCPDIAQTLAVMCAGTGIEGLFTGLETLFIKETDRVAALKKELEKVGVSFSKLPKRFSKKNLKDYFMVGGTADFKDTPVFETYDDHRMAMAFAPLAMLHPIEIHDPEVVVKSYPNFWKDLETLGFEVTQ